MFITTMQTSLPCVLEHASGTLPCKHHYHVCWSMLGVVTGLSCREGGHEGLVTRWECGGCCKNEKIASCYIGFKHFEKQTAENNIQMLLF
jgi:hypothetical protein